MTPMEKLMNGAGPIIVIFVVFLAAIGIYKFFQKRGSFAIFKTGLALFGVLAVIYFIGRAAGSG